MRYIGGKTLLLNDIKKVIGECADRDVSSFTDLFSGSCIVSQFMKDNDFKVISNDLLYFSYVIARGTVGINKEPSFSMLGIKDPFDYLNRINFSKYDEDDCFIYKNYSPNENCHRMYFQNENALRIDHIRLQIQEWKDNKLLTDDEYYYLLASLLLAVPFVANITGTFGAYLKFWDNRTYKKLDLIKHKISVKKECFCFCGDYKNILGKPTDILYADPPYNSREYLPNYHVLETIARYDYPVVKGVTGLRDYKNQRSDFCKKNTVKDAFLKLIEDSNSRYVLISYNNEALLSTEELSELCRLNAKKNSFKLFEFNYRRYKSKIPNNSKGLKEQLYFFEKKNG